MKEWLAVLAVSCVLALSTAAQQRLVLIGGGERPAAALKKFGEWSAPTKPLLIVTWASGEPDESFALLKKDFENAGRADLELAPKRPLSESDAAAFLTQLERAGGVFFSGGDQGRIMEVLKNARLREALRRKYQAGIVFGGTSAGTAIMSPKMITGEGDISVIDGSKVETVPGLGLLEGVIVDQHFIKRRRQNRLMGLIWQHPELLGLGIDEDTALLVRDGRFGEVVGAGNVLVLDARGKKDEMKFTVARPGEKIDLKKRRKVKN
jgi:cyanophycinase